MGINGTPQPKRYRRLGGKKIVDSCATLIVLAALVPLAGLGLWRWTS
jgi:hypothetical protein